MKDLILGFWLFLVSVMAFGQGRPEFEHSTYDFGQIDEESGSVSHTFLFVNKGNKALKVTNVNASCGCTTPDWTREEVLPNDTGRIVAAYNPLNRPGSFEKSLQVNFNVGSSDQLVHLYIEGSVKPRPRGIEDELPTKIGAVRMQYKSLNMGRITTEKVFEKIFEVYNAGDTAINWMSDQHKLPSHISIDYLPRRLEPAELGRLMLTYDPLAKNDLGYVSDSITLYSDELEQPEKQLLVMATIEEFFGAMSEEELARAPRLIFDKNAHDFGIVRQGNSETAEFILTNAGGEELRIRTVKPNCDCTVTTLKQNAIPPGESVTLEVKFSSSGRRGRQYKNVTVFSNDPRSPTQVLSIKADIN